MAYVSISMVLIRHVWIGKLKMYEKENFRVNIGQINESTVLAVYI